MNIIQCNLPTDLYEIVLFNDWSSGEADVLLKLSFIFTKCSSFFRIPSHGLIHIVLLLVLLIRNN